jgi:flagellar hook-length control protein FliK
MIIGANNAAQGARGATARKADGPAPAARADAGNSGAGFSTAMAHAEAPPRSPSMASAPAAAGTTASKDTAAHGPVAVAAVPGAAHAVAARAGAPSPRAHAAAAGGVPSAVHAPLNNVSTKSKQAIAAGTGPRSRTGTTGQVAHAGPTATTPGSERALRTVDSAPVAGADTAAGVPVPVPAAPNHTAAAAVDATAATAATAAITVAMAATTLNTPVPAAMDPARPASDSITARGGTRVVPPRTGTAPALPLAQAPTTAVALASPPGAAGTDVAPDRLGAGVSAPAVLPAPALPEIALTASAAAGSVRTDAPRGAEHGAGAEAWSSAAVSVRMGTGFNPPGSALNGAPAGTSNITAGGPLGATDAPSSIRLAPQSAPATGQAVTDGFATLIAGASTGAGAKAGATDAAAAAIAALPPAPSAGGAGALPDASIAALQSASGVTASQPAHAQAHIGTPVGDPGFGPDISRQLVYLAKTGSQSVELSLQPANLGPVNVTIQMSGTAATLAISASHEATRVALQDALPHLNELFRASGLQLAGAQVGDGSQQRQAQQGGGQTYADNRPRLPPGAVAAPAMVAPAINRSGAPARLIDTFV